MASKHSEYIHERDLDIFPAAEISEVTNRHEELLPIIEAFDRYRTGIKQVVADTDYQEIEPIIGHAMLSYLLYLESSDSLEYAQFLLPPTIDPERDHAAGSDKLLIAEWEDTHVFRNKQVVADLFAALLEERVALHIFTGPMYAGKTDILLQLLEECNGHISYEVIIPSVMEEAFIQSRIGGVGRTRQLEVVRKIKADKYDYSGLMTRLSTIELMAKEGLSVPKLIVIDEFSFFTENPEEGQILIRKLEDLVAVGITVIASGLHNNYRAETRPVIAVAEEQGLPIDKYTAFAAIAGRSKGIEILANAGETIRWDMRQGFLDFLLKVVIGRVHDDIVRYGVLPWECHLFAILKEQDTRLFNELIRIGGREDIFAHYLLENTTH